VPGIEVIETPRYRIVLQPDFPFPGPNSVSWIRCQPHEADAVIDEVRAVVAARGLPLMWVLEPGTRPPDFPEFLAARGVQPDALAPESAVMVLPIDAPLNAPAVDGLELRDALADPDTFCKADQVNAEAFAGRVLGDEPALVAARERRRLNMLAAGNRHLFLASIDGEPAGSGGLTLFPPRGALLNGGAVRPKFRSRGLYRALVSARAQMARDAGAAGLIVWGGPLSAPILERLGFESVGWRKFYVDSSLPPRREGPNPD
jgi:GNAT superfamily N-acetyltransferase